MFSKDDFDIPLEGQLRLRVIADEINEVAAAAHCSPHNSKENKWKKRKVI